jgi:hypothetical protein
MSWPFREGDGVPSRCRACIDISCEKVRYDHGNVLDFICGLHVGSLIVTKEGPFPFLQVQSRQVIFVWVHLVCYRYHCGIWTAGLEMFSVPVSLIYRKSRHHHRRHQRERAFGGIPFFVSVRSDSYTSIERGDSSVSNVDTRRDERRQ